MSLELVIEPPQCLMLMDGILAVESHLLLTAIKMDLLFFHLFFHVNMHLKELIRAAAKVGH